MEPLLPAEWLASDRAHVYPVLLPPGVESCDPLGGCSDAAFCGYHSAGTMAGRPVLYAVLPYPSADALVELDGRVVRCGADQHESDEVR